MRKYTLASSDARNDVDLRMFSYFIEATVHEFMPDAVVVVESNYYTVSPTPSKGDAIRIGRKLSKKQSLGQHCIKISKLFNGETIDNEKENVNGKQKCNGGHF